MLQYFKNIISGLVTPLQGIKITTDHICKPKVTRRYPEQFDPYPILPETERNRLDVNMTKCTGCQMCAKSCPVGCIKIETVRAVPTDTNVPLDENGKPKKLLVTQFNIDFALCCFCALCEEACPTGAIHRTPIFDYSSYSREDLIYNFSTFSPEEVEEKKELLDKFNAEKKAKEDAAKKAAEEANPAVQDE
ncbi:MAG: 4Fe-4S binding protein [Ignavibacteria bacterium]|jgi:formate hydrogenlyase subunit 6/NADH:ubiquinone oxidoreductase subunit I|nr:4Fe-4S binding protein [Ignavibacteria bacterium]